MSLRKRRSGEKGRDNPNERERELSAERRESGRKSKIETPRNKEKE